MECNICGKKHDTPRIFCSEECSAKYLATHNAIIAQRKEMLRGIREANSEAKMLHEVALEQAELEGSLL